MQPRYREQVSLEAVLRKRSAGDDDFVTERYQDLIATILEHWIADLQQSPPRIGAIEKALSPEFLGSALQPVASRTVRADGVLSAWQLSFPPDIKLARNAFAGELRQYLADLTEILTAEFQITWLTADPQGHVRTTIRYELVGTGSGFHREGRVGICELTWQSVSAGYQVSQWRHLTEARSRSTSPMYVDLTQHAFGSNKSYASQLVHGADYWRTVLDGSCGIDIYGHNGVSVGNVYGSGLDDVYVCQPAGLPNRLYRNRGDGTFEDVTDAAGVGVLENTACALFADLNNKGRQDLVVVRANGPLLFLNEGHGKFRLSAEAFPFASVPQGTFTGAALADYDRDGWLDIYFCLYVYYQGTDQYKYPTPYYDANNGPPNFLMRNNRDGTFRDVTAQSGLNQNNTRYSFCCGWTDSNQNGWPDLYVVNDFGRKNLYRNNGDGTFTDIAGQAGVEDVGAGMSLCCFDYDNDGAEDLYVADMWTAAGERISSDDTFRKESTTPVRMMYHKHAMGNSLFRNKGNGVFEDKSLATGTALGRWSWSSDAWDFDHDGFPDVYVSNGMISGPLREDLNSFFWRQVVAKSPDTPRALHDYEQGWTAINELIREDYSWSGFERNVFYLNNRDGTFSDVSGAVGLDFVEDGRAFALADLDGDGRLEVIIKNRNAPQIRLLTNVVPDMPPSISFCLRGTKSNRDAIGARVTIETESGRQTRTLQAGSGFLSQHSKHVFFGLGHAKGPMRASIAWPSGAAQSLNGLQPNQRVFVEEGNETIRTEPFLVRTGPSATSKLQPGEVLPQVVETWLLTPVKAPDVRLSTLDGRSRVLSELLGKMVLLHLWTSELEESWQQMISLQQSYDAWNSLGLHLLTLDVGESATTEVLREAIRKHNLLFPVLRASDDVTAIYNILYRSLFDRHRDLALPTSLLIDEQGDIIKIYRGSLNPDRVAQDLHQRPRSAYERMAIALPFPGVVDAPLFTRNYLSLGSVYFQRGYFDQAQASFLLAVRDDPGSAEAQYGLGSAYLKQKKMSEAQRSFEQAVKLNGSYPETKPNAWNNLGLLAAQDERIDAAVGFFEEALKLNPDHLISLENLGNAYRQQKRWEEARVTLERAVTIAPLDPEANYSLGMVFAQMDQSARANDYLEKALQLRPNYPEAMNNLGVLYLRTHRRDQAVALFQQCIRTTPGFDQSYLNLARVFAIEGDRVKARDALVALLKLHPGHAQAQKALQELN